MLTLIGVSSCMKKELPVALKAPGAEQVASLELGEDYRWQVYYSLRANREVGRNRVADWDFAFECSPEGYRVLMNSAKFQMKAYRVATTDFMKVSIGDTIGVKGVTDAYSGSLDSTALGDWRMGKPVFIVSRGSDEAGTFTGMCKLQLLKVDEAGYRVRVSALNNSNDTTLEIPKEDQFNFVHLSMSGIPHLLRCEPPKEEWDLLFTKYVHYYYDLSMPYAVVGCLLNRYQTSAALDTLHQDFQEINLQSAEQQILSRDINTIGFEWKSYSIDKMLYTIDTKKYYLVKSKEGIYYKMRFTAFYKNGVKGAPEWVFQQL